MSSSDNISGDGQRGFHERGRHGKRSRDVVGLVEVFSDVVSLRFASWAHDAQAHSTTRLEQLLAMMTTAPIPSPQDLQASRHAHAVAILEESAIKALSERVDHLITMCSSTLEH